MHSQNNSYIKIILLTIKIMSWSSNNGDDSPWGKNSKDNSKSSYNGSGGKSNNDDFFENLTVC